MGVLANHVPFIEQLKPGLVEVIEESGGSKQFFRKSLSRVKEGESHANITSSQFLAVSPLSKPTRR